MANLQNSDFVTQQVHDICSIINLSLLFDLYLYWERAETLGSCYRPGESASLSGFCSLLIPFLDPHSTRVPIEGRQNLAIPGMFRPDPPTKISPWHHMPCPHNQPSWFSCQNKGNNSMLIYMYLQHNINIKHEISKCLHVYRKMHISWHNQPPPPFKNLSRTHSFIPVQELTLSFMKQLWNKK